MITLSQLNQKSYKVTSALMLALIMILLLGKTSFFFFFIGWL